MGAFILGRRSAYPAQGLRFGGAIFGQIHALPVTMS